jgi:hypothetical protein
VYIIYSYIFSPKNPQELFNLCHASAHNIVERIFGILKIWFAILQHNPHLTPKVQAHLPAALAALHNIIRKYDPEEIHDCIRELDVEEHDLDELDPEPELRDDSEGELAIGPPKWAEKKSVEKRRDEIATQMWIQYQQVLQEREEIWFNRSFRREERYDMIEFYICMWHKYIHTGCKRNNLAKQGGQQERNVVYT